MTIKQILKKATEKFKQHNISSAILDAEVLLLEALNKYRTYFNESDIRECRLQSKKNNICKHRSLDYDNKKISKSWLYAHSDCKLNEKEKFLFNGFVNQRLRRKPVAYITNRKEFYGYDFYVDKNVLIPRPETELIVEEVLKILNNFYPALAEGQRNFNLANKKTNLIDIGTGSGCIAISILNELAKNKKEKVIHSVYANDISSKAIFVAKINAKKYNLHKKIKFRKNDLEKFLNGKNILNADEIIITANLPYIKNDDYKNLSEDIKKYEPRIAFVAGEDGLAFIKKLINAIAIAKIKNEKKRRRKIHVFIETDPEQIGKISGLFKRKFGSIPVKIIKDLNQNERVVSIEIVE